MAGLFVTATDTGAGKTLVSCALLSGLAAGGLETAGFKPVAAGARRTPEGLRNEDAELLQRFSSVALDYRETNPVTLEAAIAPHIAAAARGIPISVEDLARQCRCLKDKADVVVTEGAGGWLVPLSGERFMSDLASMIGDPVVMVVGMRLGCLNHALLTEESIRARGSELLGWVANRIDPHMPVFEENLSTLNARLGRPCLGVIPWLGRAPLERRVEMAMAALDLAGISAALARD